MSRSLHLTTGKAGEELATKYLRKRGFSIEEQNIGEKWGEIDIIALKDSALHFVEVKATSVSYDLKGGIKDTKNPLEHVHAWKQKRMGRMIQTYIASRRWEAAWQVDIAIVRVNHELQQGRVEMLWDVILET